MSTVAESQDTARFSAVSALILVGLVDIRSIPMLNQGQTIQTYLWNLLPIILATLIIRKRSLWRGRLVELAFSVKDCKGRKEGFIRGRPGPVNRRNQSARRGLWENMGVTIPHLEE